MEIIHYYQSVVFIFVFYLFFMFYQDLFSVSSLSKQGFLWDKGRIERFFLSFYL